MCTSGRGRAWCLEGRAQGLPCSLRALSPAVPSGAIPGGLSIGPPAKSSIDDSYGRYDLIPNSESPASPPVAVPHSWSRAKSDSDKISNGSSINWPPGESVRHVCPAAGQNCPKPEESASAWEMPGPELGVLETGTPQLWLFHWKSFCHADLGSG